MNTALNLQPIFVKIHSNIIVPSVRMSPE